MKNRIFVIGLMVSLFLSQSLSSQTIYSEPEFLTADELVTVFFNSEGTPLENYNGDVYSHTGITKNGTQWQNVIGLWGNNSEQPKLTKIGASLYKLEMDPSIRSFYGASPSDNISELCMVFRSEDAGTQSADLFLPVFSNQLEIIIQSPEIYENIMYLEGDSIFVSAVSPLADSIFLYLNNEEIKAVEDIYLNDTIIAENVNGFGELQWVTVKAVNETEMVADSFSFQLLPPPTVAEVPAGITDGINYISDTSVILSLFAPGKKFVFVIGEFNDFTYSTENYMNLTPDGNRFWIQIDGLMPGQEYAFQYTIADEAYIGDPYCEKVLDPWNDQYIDNATYPDLKPYPLSYNQGIMSVLQTNQEVYEWQNTNFTPPDVTDLVIYELLVRDFMPQHTFLSLIDTLDYLKRLGVNAIELMPVNEFEGNSSWGYNPNYYFAVDKYYGPKNTLKQFVDACHNEGIAVILDVVYNHSFSTSPYVLMYWDQNANAPSEDSPFYNVVPKHDFNVGFDMNHESQATKQYISRALKFWLEEFKVDGFRFDLSKGFTQTNTLGNPSAMAQYDQSRIDILKQYADSAWSVNPNTYVILEHFADNSEEKVLSNYGMMIWGNSNYNYNEGTMGYNEDGKSDFSWISYQKRGWSDPHVVGYMESHDEERLMYKNLTYGNSGSNYNVQDSTIALQRQQLAVAFFMTIPGPKMIWKFGELGYDYSRYYDIQTGQVIEGDDGIKVDPKPIRWDYMEDYRRKVLYNVYQELIKLKKEEPVFKTTDFSLSVNTGMKSIHLDHSSMNVTVLGNFNVTAGDLIPNFQHSGLWYDFFSGDSINVTNISDPILLNAGEYRIYTDKKLETPEIGLSVFDNSLEQSNFSKIYPNPSDDQFNISFDLAAGSIVALNIYNLNGQKVRSVFSGKLNAGSQVIVWDGFNDGGLKANKGMYLSELIIDDQKEVKKLIVK